MSMLCLANSQAMSAVRRRAPSQVLCSVRTFQLATTSGRCFNCFNSTSTFFDRIWDNTVAAVGHPGKVEQAMLGLQCLGHPPARG